jgi:peptide/nickel transport system substrate-binding protein
MFTRKSLARMVVLAVGVATVAACTATPPSSSGSTNSNSGGATAASGGAPLVVQGDNGSPSLVRNFNPYLVANNLRGNFLIYEPLEVVSPIDGSYTPALATANTRPSPSEVDYTLRSGVKWSDGTAFSASDVTFTFDLLKKYPALDAKGVWTNISSVKAEGDKVKITLKAPNVPFMDVIAQTPIVPKSLWSKVPDPTKFNDENPVGTGPYLLDAFTPTQYTMKKNPTYWQGDKVAANQVRFPMGTTNDALSITDGKFDWAYSFLPQVEQTFIAPDKAHRAYWFPPGGTITLYLNLTKKPYDSVDFRQGISKSLDRSQIAKKAVNGYLPAASSSGLILPNLEKWLDPSLPNKGIVAQDNTGATASFTKAGYKMDGNKLVDGSGKQATMTILVPNGFTDWQQAAQEVQQELGKAGIKVTIDNPQYAQYTSATQTGSFDAAFGGFGGTGNPYTDFNNALNSKLTAKIGTATTNNFERFSDPTADQALATLAAATDAAAQKKATNTLQQIMFNQAPVVLMYYGGSWGLFTTKAYTGWPSKDDPYTLPTPYNNSLWTVLTHIKAA